MLTKLFVEILKLSLYGTAAAGIIMLVKLLAGHRLPIRFHKALWMILIIKLLLPFEIPSPVSLNHYIKSILPTDSFLESFGTFRETAANDKPTANGKSEATLQDTTIAGIKYQIDTIDDLSNTTTPDNNHTTSDNNPAVLNAGLPAPAKKPLPEMNWVTIAAFVWLAGVLALLTAFFMSYIKTAIILKHNIRYTNIRYVNIRYSNGWRNVADIH